MGDKKMGRPTDNPKDTTLKVYFDKETAGKLDNCIKELEVSKSEVDIFIYGYRLGVLMTMEVFTGKEDAIFGGEDCV